MCIDLGTDSIKWVIADLKKGKIWVQDYGRLPFPPGSYSHHGPKIQLEMLESFLDDHKIRKPCIVSISDWEIPSQIKQFPDMPGSEIRDAVKWELSQNKRNRIEELHFDYLVSQPDYEKESQQKTVMIAIRRKDLIDNIEKAFSRRKLTLIAIENPSFAHVSALKRTHEVGGSSQNHIVLHIGSSATLFWVFYKGDLVFERKLNTGGEALTKAVMDYCKIDFENAAKLKEEYGINPDAMSDRIIEARQILISVLEKLASDIQYSIKYFSFQVTKSKVTAFEKIFLTGGSANLPGLPEFLIERLKQPCLVVSEKDNLIVWPKKDGKEHYPLLAMYGTALGLSWWNHKDLNVSCTSFLSVSVENRQELTKTTREKIYTGLGSLFVWMGVFCGLLILASVYHWQAQNIIRQTQERLISQEIALQKLKDNVELEKVMSHEQDALIEGLLSQKNEVMEKIKKVKSIHVENLPYAEHLAKLSRHIPELLVLEKIEMNPFEITIDGYAVSHQLVADLMSYLNNDDTFYQSDFKLIEMENKQTGSRTFFKIGAGIKQHVKA